MNSTKFRIPDTKLYLRADGTFSPKVEPGEKVLELTSKHAQVLQVVYHGQALKQLTSLNNSNAAHGGDDENELMDLGKEVVEWFSRGLALLEFAEKLNRWITDAPDAPDPIMESLNRIHETLSQIQDFNLGAWLSSRQDNLAFLLAHSSTAIQTANAFLQSDVTRDDPVWAATIAIAERDSLLAVNTFSDIQHGYWLRPESIAAISWAGNPTEYYRGWMPHIPDRAEVGGPFKQVWDYRWAQPALVYAIVARLVVLKAFATGSRAERRLHCQEIKGYVKLLGSIFSKRWAGIRTLERLSELQRHEYSITGRIPMVAADIYGGDYIGGIFFASNIKPEFFPPGLAAPNMDSFLNPTRPLDLVWVDNNVRAFAHHWWNILYLRTGLEELLLFISELQAFCDESWFSRTYLEMHEKLRLVKSDDKARKNASAAAALSDLIPTDDRVANAARTHFLYEALHAGGDKAQAVVAKCVRDLSYLAEERALSGRMNQPSRATTSAVKRRKRK